MLEDILSNSIPKNCNIILLASGFDYNSTDQASADFAAAVLNCFKRIGTNQSAPERSTQIILELIFSEGLVRINHLIKGIFRSESHHCFSAPNNDNYRKSGQTPYFASVTSRTLSISDVYFILLWVGAFRAGAITHIIFASHAWDNGPIFLNSFDPFPTIPWRSPCDKDGRIKDLMRPQLGAQEENLIRRCFHPEAFAINLGCGGSADAKAILRSKLETFQFLPEEINTLREASAYCWNQLFANACHIPCYGAHPGFPTCLELDQEFPTLAVPQKAILDRLDYSKLLKYLRQELCLNLDPWGLGLIRFDPRQTSGAR